MVSHIHQAGGGKPTRPKSGWDAALSEGQKSFMLDGYVLRPGAPLRGRGR